MTNTNKAELRAEKRLNKSLGGSQKKLESKPGKPVWTSDNCPLVVDFLPAQELVMAQGGGGKLGLCMAPGRQKKKPEHIWARDLSKDLDLLADVHKCDVLVTLLREQEMDDINVPNLKHETLSRGMLWRHFPVQDKWIPKKMDGLLDLVEYVIEQLQAGKTVVAHCNGGKGRSGTVLVATLVALGRSVDESIVILRKARDGTIRNPVQIAYVKQFKKAWRHRRKRALRAKMKQEKAMLKGLGYIETEYSSLTSSSSLSSDDSTVDVGANVNICTILSNTEMSTTLASSTATATNSNDKVL